MKPSKPIVEVPIKPVVIDKPIIPKVIDLKAKKDGDKANSDKPEKHKKTGVTPAPKTKTDHKPAPKPKTGDYKIDK